MSEGNSSSAGGGIGCLSLLGVAFVVMKLAEIGAVANWSWWWVLSPFIAQVVLFVVIVTIVLAIAIWADR